MFTTLYSWNTARAGVNTNQSRYCQTSPFLWVFLGVFFWFCFVLFFVCLLVYFDNFVCINILDIESSLFIWFMMFNATFNNISVILWLSVSLTDGDFSEMKYTHTHKYCLLFSWIVFHWIVCMANVSAKWVIVIKAKWSFWWEEV